MVSNPKGQIFARYSLLATRHSPLITNPFPLSTNT